MSGKKAFSLIAVLVALLSLAAYSIQYGYSSFQRTKQERLFLKERQLAWQELRQLVVAEIAVFDGRAGVAIKDLGTGWEISHERTKLFPAASVAKIPLMAACFLAVDQELIKLERNVALRSADKLTGSGTLKNMSVGTLFSVERLIDLMISESDNTATNMLTNLVGMDYLNKSFMDFGLRNTDLSRRIADYRARDYQGIENYTTAEDMALLLEKIYLGELGNKNISDQCIQTLKLTRSNDRIPKYLPADLTIAHKTGLENGICHDVGIVFTPKGDLMVVVLTKHENPNSTLSKEFIAKVALHAYNYISSLETQK